MNDYKERMRAALNEARQKDACSLPSLFASYGVDLIRRGEKVYARRCPFCEGKQKLVMSEFRGRWTFKCFKASCEANQGGDAFTFLKLTRGLDNRGAARALLEIAGIEHPWDQIQRERKEGGR